MIYIYIYIYITHVIHYSGGGTGVDITLYITSYYNIAWCNV
jgi:hypothetical protein